MILFFAVSTENIWESSLKTNRYTVKSSVYLILLSKLVALISLSKHNLIASNFSYLIH